MPGSIQQPADKRLNCGADSPVVPFRTAGDRDAAWNGAAPDPAVVDEAWQSWREEVDFAERFTAETAG